MFIETLTVRCTQDLTKNIQVHIKFYFLLKGSTNDQPRLITNPGYQWGLLDRKLLLESAKVGVVLELQTIPR